MAVQKETGSSQRIIRFGVFEADLAAGELRKNGLKIKLRGQPFEVLAILLERPGEVVTREELQKRLWPDGTFVDFDHSLNNGHQQNQGSFKRLGGEPPLCGNSLTTGLPLYRACGGS